MTFVTKDVAGRLEIGSTPTTEPILNYWVNTTLNKLVNQIEPYSRCIEKCIPNHFCLEIETLGPKPAFLIKHHMEEQKKGKVKT